MANNLNLKATIGLGTKDFQNGVRKIQASLNSLKMKFMSFAASLGAGVGLVDFARNLKDTAKKMNQSQTTLKNVSNSIKEYADNQKYIMDLSSKYNQDLIVLTDNFSKFHASSDEANVSLEDQKKIFESMTRASAYFNLTADETNSVFLAITQMMSKGKVSAEELRRQLGERLPGAFGVMAKAAGMTTAELDKALSTGKLMSAEILPKFAEEWNSITQNLDINTIQGLTNKLKNSFIELTKKLHVEDIYKSTLRVSERVVKSIGNHIKQIISMIGGLGVVLSSKKLFKGYTTHNTYFDSLQRDIEISQAKISNLNQQMVDFAKAHRDYSFENFKTVNNQGKDIINVRAVEGEKANHRYKSEANKLAKDMNRQLAIASALQSDLNNKISYGTKLWRGFVGVLKGLGGILKTAFATILTGAVINALTNIWMKFREIRKEAERISRYTQDMKDAYNSQIDTESSDEAIIESLKGDVEKSFKTDTKNMSEKDIKKYQKEKDEIISAINQELGLDEDKYFTEKSNLKDILTALEKEKALRKDIKALHTAEEFREKSVNDMKAAYDEYKKIWEEEYAPAWLFQNNPDVTETAKQQKKHELKTAEEKLKLKQQAYELAQTFVKQYDDEILKYKKVIAGKKFRRAQEEPDKGYENLKEEYNSKLNILNKKLADGIITKDKYDDEYKKLVEATLNSIYEMAESNKSIKIGQDAFSKKLISETKKLNIPDANKAFKEQQKKFNDGVVKIMGKYNAGAFKNNEEFAQAMEALVDETYEALAEMGYLTGNLSDFEKMIKKFSELYDNKHKQEKIDEIAKQKPTIGDRDTTFDYKKTESEIYDERAELWKEYINSLNDYINSIGEDADFSEELEKANEELEKAIVNCENIENLATFSKLKEDIDGFSKSLQSNITSGIDAISTVVDRLADDMEKLSNPEIDGWERLSIILNGILQTFDGMLNAIEMFTEMEKLLNQIAGAEASLQEAKSNANQKELAEEAALMASKQALQTQEAVGTAASLAGSTAKVAAGQAEAVAGGTASAAKLPFPFNIAAIATVIAALASVFSSMPKFANGGIVGGNSKSGDKILARLNSGEMVLNKSQQNALFNNSGGGVQFKIKGSDLVGVLSNYQKKISK